MSPLVSDSPPLFPPGARTNFGRTLFAPASSSTPAPSSVQAPPPAVSEAPGPAVTRGPPAVNGQLLSGGTSASDDILIVSCGHCDARNLVETPKDAYYVVFKGRGGVGIYRSMVSFSPHRHIRFLTCSFRTRQTHSFEGCQTLSASVSLLAGQLSRRSSILKPTGRFNFCSFEL